MSVIAVKVEKDKITVAADSIIIKDDLKRTNFRKVYKFDDIIVAGAGSAQELALFFEYAKTNKPSGANVSAIQNYMAGFLSMRETCLDEHKIDNDYIIVYKGHAYEVEGFLVQEITEYTAIGEGEAYALSALYLGHTAIEAVEAACHFSCFVSEPIMVEELLI